MIYSKTCEYAIRALLFLAKKEKGEYVQTRAISRETGVPSAYLSKIFQELVRYQILDSKRGATGGVALKRNPETISLRMIMEMVDDPGHLKSCVMGLDRCSDTNACPLHLVWTAAKQKMLREMESSNLVSITKKFGRAQYRELKRGRLNRDLNICSSEV